MSDDGGRRVLLVRLRVRGGGYVVKYAEVSVEDYERWVGYHRRNDSASMRAEAAKVLRMHITAEAANRRINDMPGLQELLIFSMGDVYADEVMP